jgi:hypothetical protein
MTFPVLLFLVFLGFVFVKAVNHRRGAALIVIACCLFVAVCLLYLLRGRSQLVYEAPLPPVATPVPPASTIAFASQPTTETTIPLEPAQPQPAGAPRPAWVGQLDQASNGESVFTVTVGLFTSKEECERELVRALRKRVDEYIDGYVGVPGAGRRVDLNMSYIVDHLKQDQYLEPTQAPQSGWPMFNLHALVRIDRKTHDLIRREHETALVQARLGYATGAFGLLLVLLGTAYGYLRLDTATKGYYSGRLKLAATAVILTAAAATALVVFRADPAAQWPLGFPAREASQFDS